MKHPNEIEGLFPDGKGGYKYGVYSSDSTIYGDTDSVYIDLGSVFDKDADEKDVIELADFIGDEVNKAFPAFMKDVFNVPEAWNSIITTEREVVSDKSIFLNKKKYIMHVINDEGITVDKMKIMGVEIKKTDTPIVIQDFLKELIDMILNHAEFDDITAFVDDFKIKYFTMDMFTIGNPKTIRNLTKYEDKLEEQGDFKGFPQHARASMVFNAYSGDQDAPITSGAKIKIIYIKHKDMDYIAIPSDITKIPEFLEGVDIDYHKQWESVHRKVEAYLKPIGLDKKSRNEALTASLFDF